jgi:hypothetical protein
MEEGSMISCVKWIKSGFPAKVTKKAPIQEQFPEEEAEQGVPMFTPVEGEEGYDDEFPEEIDESDSDEEEI